VLVGRKTQAATILFFQLSHQLVAVMVEDIVPGH
jgi:hypothetical protein